MLHFRWCKGALSFFSPTPDYTWTFTNLEGRETTIVSDGRNGYELQNFNHLLMITSIDIKHAGLYKCKVNSTYNGKDHVDERMARLDVIGLVFQYPIF